MNVTDASDGGHIKARDLHSEVVDALSLDKWFRANGEKRIISVTPTPGGIGLWVLVIWRD